MVRWKTDVIQAEQGSGRGFLHPDLVGESAIVYLICKELRRIMVVLNGCSVQDLRMLFYQFVVYIHVKTFSFD